MAAPTNYYVDPSINADSGSGTVGSPYGDLEYCLEQITRDATNGDQINIKSGTAEVLELALDVVTDYGVPAEGSPLIFKGYDTAANDGGIGEISGGGSVSIHFDGTTDYIHFVDLHLHDSGSNVLLKIDGNCFLINCELNGSSLSNNADGMVTLDGGDATMFNCYLHGYTGNEQAALSYSRQDQIGCYLDAGNNTTGVDFSGAPKGFWCFNIYTSNTNNPWKPNTGRYLTVAERSLYFNCTLYKPAGGSASTYRAGVGGNSLDMHHCGWWNIHVENWSGTNQYGYYFFEDEGVMILGGNSSYNCTTDTNYSTSFEYRLFEDSATDDFGMAASPLEDPANGDFRLKTSRKGASIPFWKAASGVLNCTNNMDPGAVQRKEIRERSFPFIISD